MEEHLYIVFVNDTEIARFNKHSDALLYMEKLEINKERDIVEVMAMKYDWLKKRFILEPDVKEKYGESTTTTTGATKEMSYLQPGPAKQQHTQLL